MALDQDTSRAQCLTPRTKTFPARSNVIFYKGAVICKRRGSKYVEIPDSGSPRSDLIPVGICTAKVDSTGLNDGDVSVCVEAGAYRDFMTGSGANEVTADMVTETVYLYDDETLYATDNDGTLSPAGELVFVDANEHDGSPQLAVYFDWETMVLLSDIAALQSSAAALNVQGGTGTLVAGVATITATITATSTIVVSIRDPGAGAITGMVGFSVPVADRTVGAPGAFKVYAIDDSKATIASAACTFDWHVIG